MQADSNVPSQPTPEVLILEQTDTGALADLLSAYGLALIEVASGDPIPGSFWGEPEAGLIGSGLYGWPATPVHSLLHEACHYICMPPSRRAGLHTDAGGDYAEENGVCYLQILLSDYLPGVGAARMLRDMDAWGYSFRLGSARAWYESDAADARDWLEAFGLLDAAGRPSWRLRNDG
jgi:hypothetical protein